MKKALAVIALGLLASASAYADDDDTSSANGAYIGVAGGISHWGGASNYYRDETQNIAGGVAVDSINENTASLGGRVFIGTWATDNVGVELGYVHFGKAKLEGTAPDEPNAGDTSKLNDELKSQAAYLDLLLGGKISDSNLRAYVKLGAYYAMSKESVTLTVTGPDSDSVRGDYNANNAGFHVGVGLNYAIQKHLELSATVEDFIDVRGNLNKLFADNSSLNILLGTVGVAYKF